MSILLRRKFRKVPQIYPKRLCFLGVVADEEIKDVAQLFELDILEPEMNNNEVPGPVRGTIYVLNEFEDNPILEKVRGKPDTWIFGPTYLKELAENLTLEIRSKPTYCSAMFRQCFYINCPKDIALMKRLMFLIQWMGGMFVKEPNTATTHMISTSTLADGYEYCNTFGVPIMTPQYVEECWANRHIIGWRAFYISKQDSLRLQPFSGLRMCFKEFSPEEYEAMRDNAESNGGEVVEWNDPRCTHMVVHVDHAHQVVVEEIAPSASYIVSSEWFFSSIKLKHRAYESVYDCLSLSSIGQSTWSVNDYLEDTSEEQLQEPQRLSESRPLIEIARRSINSNDGQNEDNSKLQLREKKRKYAFEELCQTEQSFINCMGKLLQLKVSVLDPSRKEGPILSQTEAKEVFGNLGKMIDIHKMLYNRLEFILENWKYDEEIGQAFLMLKDEMMAEYVLYSKNVDLMQKRFTQYERKNIGFRKQLEELKGNRKEDPKDIYIRPIQRLPSTILLLVEIKKHTRENHPDKESLVTAIEMLRSILRNMDDSRAKIEGIEKVFDIFNSIANCPPDLLNSQREFITQIPVRAAVVEREKIFFGPKLMLFLFNDVIEIAEQKNDLSSSKKKVKPYKHMRKISLFKILLVMCFEDEKGVKNMLGFYVRDLADDSKTTFWYQYQDEEPAIDEIVLLIAKRLAEIHCSEYFDNYIVKNKSLGMLKVDAVAPSTSVKSSFKKARQFFYKAKKPSKLRRSLSCGDIVD